MTLFWKMGDLADSQAWVGAKKVSVTSPEERALLCNVQYRCTAQLTKRAATGRALAVSCDNGTELQRERRVLHTAPTARYAGETLQHTYTVYIIRLV